MVLLQVDFSYNDCKPFRQQKQRILKSECDLYDHCRLCSAHVYSVPDKLHLHGEIPNSFHGVAPFPYQRWLMMKTITAGALLITVLHRESL